MVVFLLAPHFFVLEPWCFNSDPTIQEIYKLCRLCSILFSKLYFKVSNWNELKWTYKIFFSNICYFVIGLVKHGRSKLAAYIWLRSSCFATKTFQRSENLLWVWNTKFNESIKSSLFSTQETIIYWNYYYRQQWKHWLRLGNP